MILKKSCFPVLSSSFFKQQLPEDVVPAWLRSAPLVEPVPALWPLLTLSAAAVQRRRWPPISILHNEDDSFIPATSSPSFSAAPVQRG